MSRKHFKAFAENLKVERPGVCWDANKKTQWNLDVKAVAKVCKSFNAQFKHERFYEACGGLFEYES